jgi:hypothetical protein
MTIPAPQPQKKKEEGDARVVPLDAGVVGRDLARSEPAVSLAAERTEREES